MKKKLFTLLVCAFAVVSANAWETSADGTTWIIYGNGVDGKTSDISNIQNIQAPSGVTTIEFVGSFPNGWNGTWFNDNGSVESKSSITNIDLSEIILPEYNPNGTNPSWGFSNFQNPQLTITWNNETTGKSAVVSYFPQNTFKNCGMETLHVPGYIKRIFRDAVVEASNMQFLKTVIFDEYGHTETVDGKEVFVSDVNMAIDQMGFQLIYGLSDVYINSEGNISADNNAFPHHQTYGHGNTQVVLATLHFPESQAAKYANLNHVLTEDIAKDDAAFHNWLVDHYNLAGGEQNGFYEFVSNGISNENAPDMGDEFLTTYSFAPTTTIDVENILTAEELAYARENNYQIGLAQIVPPGVKAYIVNELVPNESSKTVTMKLKRVNVVPAFTGVILFGGTNSTSSDGTKKTLSMKLVTYIGNYYDRSNTNFKNYLTGTANLENKQPYLKPYQIKNGKVVRDFVMAKFSKSDAGVDYYSKNENTYGNGTGVTDDPGLAKGDWVGFFRSKPGNMKLDKAYLELDETEFNYPEGGEIIINFADQINTSNEDTYYRSEYKGGSGSRTLMSEDDMKKSGFWYKTVNNTTSKITWYGLWGKRNLASGFHMAKFMGEIEDEEWMETLGVSSIEAKESKTEGIFNLQGMKVAKPQKGIYIQNGKKFIVK